MSIKSRDPAVGRFIDDLQAHGGDQHAIVCALRELFANAPMAVAEGIKYGGIVYQIDGQLVAGIFAYKNHVSLEFGRGSELADAHQLLEGNGKFRRHLKFSSIKDVESKHASEYIAATLELSG